MIKVKLLEKEDFDKEMLRVAEEQKIITLMRFNNADLMHFVDSSGVVNLLKSEYEELQKISMIKEAMDFEVEIIG